MSAGALLQVEELGKTFAGPNGWLPVLAGVELQVREGEFLSVIGPSGCGKTTLLRCIGGFERGNPGRILVNGREVRGPGLDRMMVFQNFNQLFPWLTVLGNVELALKAAGWRQCAQRRRQAFTYLEMVSLEHFASYYPHQLSGGMQQRVAIARALCVRPRILLMDEPFAALDALARNTLQQELLRIWKETGVTILFVTHNVQEAIVQSDRVLVLRQLGGVRTTSAEGEGGTAAGSIAALIQVELERPRSPDRPGFGALWRELHSLIGLDLDVSVRAGAAGDAAAAAAAGVAGRATVASPAAGVARAATS